MENDWKGLIIGNKYSFYKALIKYLNEVMPSKQGAKRESVFIKKFINDIAFI